MARQAIVTRYIGPSNTRGSRVKASAQAGSVIVHWDDAHNSDWNHDAAARALAGKLDWKGNWYAGGCPDGRGNAYVCGGVGQDEPVFVV